MSETSMFFKWLQFEPSTLSVLHVELFARGQPTLVFKNLYHRQTEV